MTAELLSVLGKAADGAIWSVEVMVGMLIVTFKNTIAAVTFCTCVLCIVLWYRFLKRPLYVSSIRALFVAFLRVACMIV